MSHTDDCVRCGKDTSFGSGRFVNRLPASADYEVIDDSGNVIYEEGQYRDGYYCAECAARPCCRCDHMIPLDEDITAHDCGLDEFTDGSYCVHEQCLTVEETKLFKQMRG